MKITPIAFLTAVACGNLFVSPTAAKALPIIVADDEPRLKKKEEGISFSGNHVALNEEELKELQSMLTTFEQENSRLEASFFGSIGKFVGKFVLKAGVKCIGGLIAKRGCRPFFGEEADDGMMMGKENKIELSKDQALQVELFLDAVAQATIADDREDPDEDNIKLEGNERMVAILDTTMSPVFEDKSLALTANPELSEDLMEMSEFLDDSMEKAGKQPISRFTALPMTQQETNGLMTMLEGFEKENSVLKENEAFWGGLISIGASIVTSFLRRDVEGGLGSQKKMKKINLELTKEQGEALEAYLDEVGDKFIKEDRAAVATSHKQTLRGGEENGEEGFFTIAGIVGSALFSLLRDEE